VDRRGVLRLAARARRWRRRVRWGAWARRALAAGGSVAASLVGLSLLAVAAYRFAPPPATSLMAWRALQGEAVRYDYVPLEAISPHLAHAVIGAEDSRFCGHRGFDVEAIREAIDEARRGGRLRGASTISQQTAKNAFLWPGRGWIRKGAEAYFTALIETAWPKRRILEVYLNIAEWGDGLFGAEAAAQARFGKPAAALTAREAALLASVLPNPRDWRVDPPGDYVSRRASALQGRADSVRAQGLNACVR